MKRARRSKDPAPSSLLCLDPGETTGWALFRNGVLTGSGQFRVTSPAVFDRIFTKFKPTQLVVENYRIYPWRSKQHEWSEVPTLRYIGMIQYIAASRGIPVSLQMAQLAKVFATATFDGGLNEAALAFGDEIERFNDHAFAAACG